MGVYDFDLESYIGLARRLGTDTKRVEVKAAVFEHIGRRGGSGVGGARGFPGCSGL